MPDFLTKISYIVISLIWIFIIGRYLKFEQNHAVVSHPQLMPFLALQQKNCLFLSWKLTFQFIIFNFFQFIKNVKKNYRILLTNNVYCCLRTLNLICCPLCYHRRCHKTKKRCYANNIVIRCYAFLHNGGLPVTNEAYGVERLTSR